MTAAVIASPNFFGARPAAEVAGQVLSSTIALSTAVSILCAACARLGLAALAAEPASSIWPDMIIA